MLPQPTGDDFRTWGRRLVEALGRFKEILAARSASSSAAEDGALLWDRELQCPVVSRGGAFAPVLLFVAAPASASASGEPGQIAYDGSYIYVCTAADTWRRASIATW